MSKQSEAKQTAKYSEAGKGDKARRGISPEKWSERWEKIFGKKQPDTNRSDIQNK